MAIAAVRSRCTLASLVPTEFADRAEAHERSMDRIVTPQDHLAAVLLRRLPVVITFPQACDYYIALLAVFAKRPLAMHILWRPARCHYRGRYACGIKHRLPMVIAGQFKQADAVMVQLATKDRRFTYRPRKHPLSETEPDCYWKNLSDNLGVPQEVMARAAFPSPLAMLAPIIDYPWCGDAVERDGFPDFGQR